MNINVISIGNSKGIRIPKAILEQCNITDKVDLEIVNQEIKIKAFPRQPRDGWEKSIKKAVQKGTPELLFPDNLDNDHEDLEWK